MNRLKDVNVEILGWIEQWYRGHCDGDWEHQYGVEIGTVDNPGWYVKIDLMGTSLENKTMQYVLFEEAEDDWYGMSMKQNVFHGAGDPTKLTLLLKTFREIVVQHEGSLS